jgi:NhaP-type Na+/H+ or K+/H+ antiporter
VSSISYLEEFTIMSEQVEAEAESPTLALVIALLIGLVVRSISTNIPQKWRVFPLPYTAIILVIGVVIGILTQKTPDVAYASDSFRSLEGISPSTLFTVFLPALIIPSGLSLHWHVVKRVLDKALLLAVFGTIFNAGITAIILKYVFPYSWPWSGCFLLSAVLAATDPVAVVSIMHSVGASKKLSTIIEGESLLNDGVAFVLFEIFREWASGEHLTAGGIVSFAFKASLGGPLLGLVWAGALALWLAITFNDGILEVTTSLVAGYALWLVSDEMLGLSGMLSLVFFATALGAYGKSRISRSVTTSFDFFWEWVDWVANSLIFFLSGLITALELMKVSTIAGSAWGWAVVLWLFLFVIRTLMVVLFYPILQLGQYGINWKDAIVLSWAGLRGAVGLTLALIVYYSDNVLDKNYREHFFFFVSFIAFITLVVQGSTTSLLLEVLGYLKLTPAMKSAMIHAAGAVDRLGAARIAAAKKAPSLLGEAEWSKVKTYTKLDLTERVVKRSKAGGYSSAAKRRRLSMLKHTNATLSTEEREMKRSYVHDMRERILQMVLALYKDAFSANYLSPDESLTLYESVEKSLDTIEDEELSDWNCLEEKITKLEVFEKLQEIQENSSMSSSSKTWQKMWLKARNLFISKRKEARSNAEMVHAFICAHAQARKELKMYIDIEFAVEAQNPTAVSGLENALNFDLEKGKPSIIGTSTNNGNQKTDGAVPPSTTGVSPSAPTTAPAAATEEKQHQLSGDDVSLYWREDSHSTHPIATNTTTTTTGINNANTDMTNSSALFPMGSAASAGFGGLLEQHASDLIRSLSTIQRMTTRDKNQAANIKQALKHVLEESRTEQARAEEYLQKFKKLCPKAVENLRTAHVSMQVLKKESEFLERLHAMGLLEEREVAPVLKKVERRIQRLNLADYESLPFLKPEPES